MTIHYSPDENDFLTYQLFFASKSESIKKKRRKSKVNIPIGYLVLGLLFLIEGSYWIALFFFVSALLWFFLYPIWESRHYIKHFKNFIKDNYKERLGKTAMLEINNDYIFTKDEGSESKVLTTEVKEISEIPSAIYIRLKGSQAFILPKDKIAEIAQVSAFLKDLATHLNIQYINEDTWEWK